MWMQTSVRGAFGHQRAPSWSRHPTRSFRTCHAKHTRVRLIACSVFFSLEAPSSTLVVMNPLRPLPPGTVRGRARNAAALTCGSTCSSQRCCITECLAFRLVVFVRCAVLCLASIFGGWWLGGWSVLQRVKALFAWTFELLLKRPEGRASSLLRCVPQLKKL